MKYYSVDTRITPPRIIEVRVSRETKTSVVVRKYRGLSKRVQDYNGYTIAYFKTYEQAKKFWLSHIHKNIAEAKRLVRVEQFKLRHANLDL